MYRIDNFIDYESFVKFFEVIVFSAILRNDPILKENKIFHDFKVIKYSKFCSYMRPKIYLRNYLIQHLSHTSNGTSFKYVFAEYSLCDIKKKISFPLVSSITENIYSYSLVKGHQFSRYSKFSEKSILLTR